MAGNMDLARDIKLLRKSLGLTQRQFAERLAVSRDSVIAWESGKKYPRPLALRELARLGRRLAEPKGV